MRAGASPTSTASTTMRPCERAASAASDGISSRHGTHHVAQKLTITVLPRSLARSTGLPCRSASASAGVAPSFHASSVLTSTAATPGAAAHAIAKPNARVARSAASNRGELTRTDRVLEIVRIERIETALAGFRLRIHQESDRTARRAGKTHVVREIPRDPVHFPSAEQRAARGDDHRVVFALAAILLEDDLAHVGGVDRHPTQPFGIELGAAMLRTRDVARLAEALVAARRVGDTNAVRVACRYAQRARHADEQRVQVGALAAQVARLEHELDIAGAAAAHLRVAERVVADPVVERTRTLDIGMRAARDRLRGVEHDAVGGQQRRRVRITLCEYRIERGGWRRTRQVDAAVARRDATRQRDTGLRPRLPGCADERSAVRGIGLQQELATVARPAVAEALLPVGVLAQRNRQPDTRRPCRKQHVYLGGQLEHAPARARTLGRAHAERQRRRSTRRRHLQEITSLHLRAPSDSQSTAVIGANYIATGASGPRDARGASDRAALHHRLAADAAADASARR